ncbi:STY1053 family phage-associated protein, partial [Burkholderia gladioli]
MVKLHVHTPFTLRHDDGTLEQFTEGERDMPSATAAHWYVKHHTRAPGDV